MNRELLAGFDYKHFKQLLEMHLFDWGCGTASDFVLFVAVYKFIHFIIIVISYYY